MPVLVFGQHKPMQKTGVQTTVRRSFQKLALGGTRLL